MDSRVCAVGLRGRDGQIVKAQLGTSAYVHELVIHHRDACRNQPVDRFLLHTKGGNLPGTQIGRSESFLLLFHEAGGLQAVIKMAS